MTPWQKIGHFQIKSEWHEWKITVNDKKGFYLPHNPLKQHLDKDLFQNTDVILIFFIFTIEEFQTSKEKMKIWRYVHNIQPLLVSRTW